MNDRQNDPHQTDSRLNAFCNPNAPEIFYSVAHYQEIWNEDPFDVEEIHADARDIFDRLLSRATCPPYRQFGKILLIKGEAGSGKTHLMRAFRNVAHSRNLGYFGYMQMSSDVSNYGRYILSNLIHSLNMAFDPSRSEQNGLLRLSNALLESIRNGFEHDELNRNRFSDRVSQLRSDELEGQSLSELIHDIADMAIEQEDFLEIDPRIVNALIYLQTSSNKIHTCVYQFLRGHDLSLRDRRFLGDIVPMTEDGDAIRIVQQLGILIQRVEQAALVICLDQLEDIYNLENAAEKFQKAMTAVCEISDRVPSSVIVVSCLEDYYTDLRSGLTRSRLDRIEEDPKPILLSNQRNLEEIQRIIELRLRYLYEWAELSIDEDNPCYPYPIESLSFLERMRTRDIIDQCRQYREHWIEYGTSPERWPGDRKVIPPTEDNLESVWNDFLSQYSEAPPVEAEILAKVLSSALNQSSEELGKGIKINAINQGSTIKLDGWNEAMIIGLCLKDARGGGLKREIEGLEAAANGRKIIIARNTPYSKNPKSKIANYIGELITHGARRITIEDSDWRAMIAFEKFLEMHQDKPEFPNWRRHQRPLTRLESIKKILNITDGILPVKGTTSQKDIPTTPPSAQPKKSKLEPSKTSLIQLGYSNSRAAEPITLNPQELTRHTAFLGGTGSGKTTLALTIIEQLLLQGLPVILIDRKGDLCSYADPSAWERPMDDSSSIEQRRKLRDAIQVDLFTPGHIEGRSLSIPLMPGDLSDVSDNERENIAHYAAYALGSMMDYRISSNNQKQKLAILLQAISTLSQLEKDKELNLDTLMNFINEKDTALVQAIGHLDIKLFGKLASDLQMLQIMKGKMLQSSGELLNINALLEPPSSAKRSRLTIISLKFLTDMRDLEFWMARFLVEMERWSSRHPSKRLQAVLMLDEADFYLPATRKPSTKEPMENLLRRARSAGLGIFLASQSPADFDYKCRDNIQTWFLGRIRENPALAKLKPMLSEHGLDIINRLPGQIIGEFCMVREKTVQPIRGTRSIIDAYQIAEERILELAQSKSG